MKRKINVMFSIIEFEPGKIKAEFDYEEKDATMKDIALLLYQMKQFEQQLIDRQWHTDDYYEIEKD